MIIVVVVFTVILYGAPIAFAFWWIIQTNIDLKNHQAQWDAIRQDLREHDATLEEFEDAYNNLCERFWAERKMFVGACFPRKIT